MTARLGVSHRFVLRNCYTGFSENEHELHVCRRGALGDVLLCTPALRLIKLLYPSRKIYLYTECGHLVTGLPFIHAVRGCESLPATFVELKYEHLIPPPRHIAKLFGDQLGVNVLDIRPSIVVRESASGSESIVADVPSSFVVISRTAGPWTPNKDWPDENWRSLVKKLLERSAVVDVGNEGSSHLNIDSSHYFDLRGKTSLDDLVRIISLADVHVGPISGPVHIAAAVNTRSVVIYGGYEHPRCSAYPWNKNLYSAVSCSPCWLRTPCPFEKKCLHLITVDEVLAAASQVMTEGLATTENL